MILLMPSWLLCISFNWKKIVHSFEFFFFVSGHHHPLHFLFSLRKHKVSVSIWLLKLMMWSFSWSFVVKTLTCVCLTVCLIYLTFSWHPEDPYLSSKILLLLVSAYLCMSRAWNLFKERFFSIIDKRIMCLTRRLPCHSSSSLSWLNLSLSPLNFEWRGICLVFYDKVSHLHDFYSYWQILLTHKFSSFIKWWSITLLVWLPSEKKKRDDDSRDRLFDAGVENRDSSIACGDTFISKYN